MSSDWLSEVIKQSSSSNQVDLSIIVPCYNEEEGLAQLFERLSPVLSDIQATLVAEVIFIDDGSDDGTRAILERHCYGSQGTALVHHQRNLGIGAAIRTGVTNSSGKVIVTIDSDCTYLPQDIPRLLEYLVDDWDIVTASPYHPNGGVENVPEYRLVLSKGITRLYNLILGLDLFTYTAMFRAYRREVFDRTNFKHDDFIAMVEILVNAIGNGYRVREMPTTLHSRVYGTSKMRILKVIWNHLKFIVNVRGSEYCA